MENLDIFMNLISLLERDIPCEFDYSYFNNADLSTKTILYNGKQIHNCGTTQCAAGHLPFITDKAMFDHEGSLQLQIIDGNWWQACAKTIALFFGISEDASNHLFFPLMQDPSKFGGVPLDNDATKEQVIHNMKQFLVKMNIL